MPQKTLVNAVLKLVHLPWRKLVPLQNDDLKITTKEEFESLKASMLARGITDPLGVWDDKGKIKILDGHRRRLMFESLEKEGYTIPLIPCVSVSAKNEKEAREILLSNVSQYGKVSDEGLYRFMHDTGMKFPQLEREFVIPGMSLKDFGEAYFKDVSFSAKESSEDDVPEVKEKATTKPGQIFKLGAHRLMCGDSTDRKSVTSLIGSAQADLVFTDPPYGVSYQTEMSVEEAKARNRRTDGKEVANDSLVGEDLRRFLVSAIQAWPLRPGGVYYVCSPAGDRETDFRLSLAAPGSEYPLRQALVWSKQQFVFGRQDYHWRHETILYGWREGAAHYFVEDRTQDTVWQFDRPHKSPEHPTMKPVELIEKAVANSSQKGEVVWDGFGGSGSTLIACEKIERRCFMMEIDPHYCDVIIKRWENFTGKKAELLGHQKKSRPARSTKRPRKGSSKAPRSGAGSQTPAPAQ